MYNKVGRAIKSHKWYAYLDKTEWFGHMVSALDAANTVAFAIRVRISQMSPLNRRASRCLCTPEKDWTERCW